MARILVVDDEELLRETLRAFLELEGHTVLEASDGMEAVELCASEQPDILVTDLVMPARDGLETIRHSRRKHPGVKIVAISGRGGDSINANLTRACTSRSRATNSFRPSTGCSHRRPSRRARRSRERIPTSVDPP
jgi:two-component system, chemotaxis family, chemotaxis protein CheY